MPSWLTPCVQFSASLQCYKAFRLSTVYLLFSFSLGGDEGSLKPAQMA